MTELDKDIGRRIADLRKSREWPLELLAEKAGVSRATLSRIERGDTSPTAVVLGQLARAFGLSMADLFGFGAPLLNARVKRDDQSVWLDPETGFRRRSVSPSAAGFRGSVIEGELPAGQTITYSLPPLPDLEHHLVLLEGALMMTLGDSQHALLPGDCLRFRLNSPNSYHAPGPDPARYLLTVITP
ncbi:helix-turn-helix domain-containing protein [Roseibium aggregatum]|uniref:Helix-turn-helix domain-containing protein n=1 Tax=Roseibium aggregatum TaxID=187304 RepID=A0A939EDE2_9HYPH|nr:helix-turn-helix domain-containing protein [Roseibium aggregatum]MBN9669549.1 helix-turn-helix domain-containing protein [Roseibium aggregatum]